VRKPERRAHFRRDRAAFEAHQNAKQGSSQYDERHDGTRPRASPQVCREAFRQGHAKQQASQAHQYEGECLNGFH
jgi:hypothetical protein